MTRRNDNSILFNALRAITDQTNDPSGLLNTRKIVYFESKNVKNAVSPRDGFITTGTPKGNSNAPTPITMKVGDSA